ncbi:DUF4212 domain-containing protein [Puniceicoccus vermicola]|uniref:DUF4212 domain-containing protein n=1 Tax=Puniceicoccus vermicola TaxID=388746 RepID=A0A7X1AXM3_9BACT|nr:DUF4212 domain-containing protein [Puniceicoccus vermicola]MBC2601784.1 DUF4212 domain-containing protein [Puniceicoccus vermicola]
MPPPPPESPPQALDPAYESQILKSYWRRNIILMLILLSIWAAAGLGCGILFADTLNQYTLPGTGYPLGFWFAQQGSIIVFVFLILIYALIMNRLDRSHMADRTRSRAGKEAAQ